MNDLMDKDELEELAHDWAQGKRRPPPYWVMLCSTVLFCAALLSYFTLRNYNQIKAFETEGQVAEARIVDLSSVRSSRTGYTFTCTYIVDGREYRSTVKHVPSRNFEELHVGQIVEIEYLPDDPGIVRHHFITHSTSDEYLGIAWLPVAVVIGIGVVGIGIDGAIRLYNRRKFGKA
jgi:hypothetical protein